MGFELVKENYAGSIQEISIGKGKKAVTVGGETCYPFYNFEGAMPHKPRIAMEIWDIEPEDWPDAATAHFKDVIADPAAWAKKCVKEFGAEMIVLQLKSIDPNGNNAGPDEAVATVKKVLKAIDVPLIVWGCTSPEKDEEVFKKIAEACQDTMLTIGPVEDKNHKGIGAAAMGYGHIVISSSPIDVNLAKQVNILLENLGMPMDRVIIDPTTGGLGYGMEYTYSVMERIRMAALVQGDDKLQFPFINDLGNEIWKCKEAKQSAEEAPELGDPEKRGILMEAVGAVAYLMAGSDIMIMRHPEAIRMVKSFIDLSMDGGAADDVAGIAKQLDEVKIDYAAIAPKPDLKIEEEEKKAPEKAAPKKAAAPEKAPEKVPEKKASPKKSSVKCVLKPPPPQFDKRAAAAPAAATAPEPAPAAPAAPAAAVPAVDITALKAQIMAEVKDELEAEEKGKAAAAEKEKTEARAKKKAEDDAAEKAEADARAKREEEENELRLKRAEEREKLAAERAAKESERIPVTPADEEKTQIDLILDRLDRIHRKIPLY